MSKSAKKKRSLPPPPPRDKEGSGRFAIGSQGQRPATVLPPASPQAQSAQALEALPLLEIEPDAIDSAEPQRGLVSGVFGSSAQATPAADEELEAAVTSLHAYYSAHERNHERAELVIEDLSLRLDNPYAASSLVPPPKKPFPIAKVAGIAAALIALGSGAWFAARSLPVRTENTHATAAAPAVSTRVAKVETAPAVVTPAITERVVESAKSAPATAETAAVAPEPQQPVQAKIEAVAIAPRVAQAPRVAPQAAIKSSENAAAAAVEADKTADTTAAAHPVQAADGDVADVALRAALGNAAQHADTQASTAPAGEAANAAPSGETASAPVAEAQPAAAAVAAQDLGALPETPSREDVITGFEAVRGALSTCAGAKHGVVQIDATIASSGRVSRSLIAGVFQGTPEGSCMARVARTARFPQFSQPSLNVNFPISL